MTMNIIEEYWEQQAETHGDSHWASWGDNYAIDLEIENIGRHISDGDQVLDVGCANGFSTTTHLGKNIQSIVGVDFSAKMIAQAQERAKNTDHDGRLRFEVGDVRKLRFPDQSFDVVYTTRVLINLPTWGEQLKGINECIRVCRNGGKIIFSESFWEPMTLLNAMRALVRLPPLVEHDFNRYLKMHKLTTHLQTQAMRYEIIDFSSVYYLGSRLLRELVTIPEDYPGYSNPINKIFYEIEKEYSGGGFGIQQAVVIRK